MDDLTGTALEGTEEASRFDLWMEAKDRAKAALVGRTPTLSTGLQARTHHGGVGNKTPEQWKWWRVKANWDRN